MRYETHATEFEMLVGTNQDSGQRYNRRVVFDLVRLRGSLSRPVVAREIGLSYQSVSNMADSLIADGLLIETRSRSGRRGQPPLHLSVNPKGGYSLGFFVDRKVVRGALVDLAGTVLEEAEVVVASSGPATVLPAVAALGRQLAGARPAAAGRLFGLGLGMPGLSRQGRLVSSARQSAHDSLAAWADTPIVDTLQKLTGLAVFTDNDAAAAAVGELLYGEARQFTDFLSIHLSHGIGSGLILGRKPYRGAYGFAGEIGHMTVDASGPCCPCGRKGCLELYASLNAAWHQVGAPGDPLDTALLVQLLEARDRAMMSWILEAGRMLRQAIVSIDNLLDLQSIFLGGTIPPSILDALIVAVEPLPPRIAMVGGSSTTRLRKGKVGNLSATLGAAALPIFEETVSDMSLLWKRV